MGREVHEIIEQYEACRKGIMTRGYELQYWSSKKEFVLVRLNKDGTACGDAIRARMHSLEEVSAFIHGYTEGYDEGYESGRSLPTLQEGVDEANKKYTVGGVPYTIDNLIEFAELAQERAALAQKRVVSGYYLKQVNNMRTDGDTKACTLKEQEERADAERALIAEGWKKTPAEAGHIGIPLDIEIKNIPPEATASEAIQNDSIRSKRRIQEDTSGE